ncbi:MAG: UDP-N-acetylglucosamine 2-epimerase, partial [Dehalococcoidia bacterium]
MIELRLLVTGAHLSPEYGKTIEDIDYPIFAKYECAMTSDTKVATIYSHFFAGTQFANCIANNKPDCVIFLGDRY